MGNITANKAKLYESIEDGLSLAGQMIDRCEAYEGEMSAARAVVGKALASLEILRAEMVEGDWYEVSDGVNRFTTGDWHAAVEAVTEWHNCLMDESPEKEFPEPEDIFRHVLQGKPDLERLNALIEAWEAELIDCYGYINFPVRAKRVSEIDAHSVVENRKVD